MEKHLRIQIAGPSGVGKTTLAKDISDIYGIPYVSGSYSDLIPSTKDILHSDMISMDPKEIYQNDFQFQQPFQQYLNHTFLNYRVINCLHIYRKLVNPLILKYIQLHNP